MPTEQLTLRTPERIRAELQALPGVHAVMVADPLDRVFLICEPHAPASPVEAAANVVLARAGYAPGEVDVQLAYRAQPQPPRRARFLDARIERPRAGAAVATVVLEWGGERHEGVAEGEGGPASELRVCALATIAALESVLSHQVQLQLVGVKQVHVFDSDLVTALLRCPDVPERRLVGTSLVSDATARSAALAVLNACNRLVGNYLHTPD